MRLAPVAALVALAACDTDFAPQYLVKELRVLAVRAEVDGGTAADATPGSTVLLRALVANPHGDPFTVRWYGCLPRGDEAAPSCLDEAVLRDPARLATTAGVVPLGEGETISVRVDDYAAAVEAALGFVLDRALSEPTYQCLLYAEMPVVAVVEGGGRRELALKRVRVTPASDDPRIQGPPLAREDPQRPDYVPNDNPVALAVLRSLTGGGSCAGGITVGPTDGAYGAGETALCGIAAAGSTQEYNVCDGAGEPDATREGISWQWYVTAGEFPDADGIGNATDNPIDFIRPAGAFTLWAIVRDGRGGESWLTREVPPAP